MMLARPCASGSARSSRTAGRSRPCLNRNLFIARTSSIGSSSSSSRTRPVTRRMRPSSRIRLLPSVDFPQPDSPARPMISPSATENVTPSSCLHVSPQACGSRRSRSSTWRLIGSRLPKPRVEDLVEADVHHVQAGDDRGDRRCPARRTTTTSRAEARSRRRRCSSSGRATSRSTGRARGSRASRR